MRPSTGRQRQAILSFLSQYGHSECKGNQSYIERLCFKQTNKQHNIKTNNQGFLISLVDMLEFGFLIYSYFMYLRVLFACMYVHYMFELPLQSRGGRQIPWNRSYKGLGAALWVLGIEPG